MRKAPEQDLATAKLLRSRAENQLLGRQTVESEGMSARQMQDAIHELHVHQIELEMQNEQLRITQLELELARERYLELYDFAPVGYLTLSRAGLVLQANHTCGTMLRVERPRLLANPFSNFVFTEDQDAYYHCWRKVFADTGVQSCEIRLRPASGVIFYARLEAIRATEEKQQVCRMTLSDVTERRQAEESLRKSEERRIKYESEEWKRFALEAGELGALDQDLATGRISCSVHACAMLDFPPCETISWEELVARVHPEDRPAFSQGVHQSADPKGPRRCEIVFRTALKGRTLRWLRFVARTFFEGAAPGKAGRRTGILADITRQKEAEELLRSRAKQLEGLVSERTMRLQEAVSDLEHFSYTLVHDLRAPLRAIGGYSSLLLDQCPHLSPTHRTYLERSHSAVERMDGLILDALNYSKIVRQDFSLTPIDCAALLRDLVESYPQFQEARQCISIPGFLPPVLGNHALLTQCFSNLLTNALKFVSPGTAPWVRIYAEEKGKCVRLWFQDNGIGMAEQDQEKIFRMFQRLNRDYEGTGIGLALVKKAVERMRGTIGVESKPGQGSRFWLELQKADAS